jgi:hypothetical protein
VEVFMGTVENELIELETKYWQALTDGASGSSPTK